MHLWAYDRHAARIPTRGNPYGARIGWGSWKCVVCKTLRAWACKWDRRELPGDCPGAPRGGEEVMRDGEP